MFDCPNCKEALGDDIRICPFCRHELTSDERYLIEKTRREEAQKVSAEESRITAEFSSLRAIWMLGTVALCLLIMVVFSFLMFVDLVYAGLVVFIVGMVLLFIASVVFLVFLRANCCPHCGKFLFRNFGTQCQWCGKSIR
ncbi:MAG: hypothetical protein K6F65_07285 [Lachnospiraceae bacterium]|nr:hypothetical protein [Lachnospiraceae bacterium]